MFNLSLYILYVDCAVYAAAKTPHQPPKKKLTSCVSTLVERYYLCILYMCAAGSSKSNIETRKKTFWKF